MTASSAGRHEWVRRYSLREKASLTLEIVATYARVTRRLRNTQLIPLVEDLRRRSPGRSAYGDPLAEKAAAIRIGRAIGRIVRFLPGDSRCLVRSLVLTEILARRGVASTLIVGVAPAPKFQAHAWVEIDGVALLPSLEHIHERIVEL
jgi:hypothetical protein